MEVGALGLDFFFFEEKRERGGNLTINGIDCQISRLLPGTPKALYKRSSRLTCNESTNDVNIYIYKDEEKQETIITFTPGGKSFIINAILIKNNDYQIPIMYQHCHCGVQ